ncbi:MAG: hypothetical protein WAL12_11385 [Trebonia sp.]
MTLINDNYLAEILDGLRVGGEEVLHVFLDLDPAVLRQRITDRVLVPNDPERDQQGRDFCLRNLDRGIAAAARVPRARCCCAPTSWRRTNWLTRC